MDTKTLFSKTYVLPNNRTLVSRETCFQWSQKILIINIIIWNLLWDKRPQTIQILHECNKKSTRFQSKGVVVPGLLTYCHEERLPNHLIQTRFDQTLPIWMQSGSFYRDRLNLIPTWISNHMLIRVWAEITYPIPKLQRYSSMLGLKLIHFA